MAAQSESNRRSSLFTAASRKFAVISEMLLTAITKDAPIAGIEGGGAGGWQVRLGIASLTLTKANLTGLQRQADFSLDVIATCQLDLTVPPNPHGYDGRSHSLWYVDAQEAGHYEWFETAFTLSAFAGNIAQRDPFALAPDSNASLALSTTAHTHLVGWPFTPLQIDGIEDFVDRWAGWLGEASTGALRRPSTPERPPDGTWRRS